MTSENLQSRVQKHWPDGTPRLAKLAVWSDAASGETLEQYVFTTSDGTLGELFIERGKASELRVLHTALLSANADIPRHRASSDALLRNAVEMAPSERFRYVPTVGWSDDSLAFALHWKVVGSREHRTWRPPRSVKNMRHLPGPTGTVEGWRELTDLCQYSKILLLSLALAFAAALAKFSGLQPFGINLFGRSRTGKSTAALAAASVFGIGEERMLPNWDITPAGFQELSRQFNDHLLVLNEAGVVRSSSKRESYEIVRRFCYVFAEGAEVTRHSSSGYAVSNRLATWRGACLSTSEKSITELANEAGRNRDEGEFARFSDVPAVTRSRSTIIDAWPTGVANRRQFSIDCLARIRTICHDHHGVAYPEYIRALVAKGPDQVTTEVRSAIQRFEEAVGPMGGPLGHAAKNFGLIYAGGLQAIDAGLLPVTEGGLLAAVKKCFESMVETVPLPEAVERRALRVLRSAINDAAWRGVRSADVDQTLSSRSTFRTTIRGKRTYLVGLDAFDDWFGGDASLRNAALFWLQRKGLLRLQRGVRLMAGRVNREDYTKYHRVGGRNWRFVQFRSPRLALG